MPFEYLSDEELRSVTGGKHVGKGSSKGRGVPFSDVASRIAAIHDRNSMAAANSNAEAALGVVQAKIDGKFPH
ncbi:hypothetical protein SCG7086_DK_00020 [Chlamydiales bacterium SCGC AG-110-P3]|nr:hypothetical protein SCG7086_DK_00020 [Chlamydiales bacterium SCGC AG-110-P3]